MTLDEITLEIYKEVFGMSPDQHAEKIGHLTPYIEIKKIIGRDREEQKKEMTQKVWKLAEITEEEKNQFDGWKNRLHEPNYRSISLLFSIIEKLEAQILWLASERDKLPI